MKTRLQNLNVNNTEMDLKANWFENVDQILVSQGRLQWESVLNSNGTLDVVEGGNLWTTEGLLATQEEIFPKEIGIYSTKANSLPPALLQLFCL